MKKKHLKSLSTIEKWLIKEAEDKSGLDSAFETIRMALQKLPDSVESSVMDSLPRPVEISEEPDTIAIFSDGGCRGNPGPGAYAYVIQNYDGEILAEGVEFEGHTTNNKMELSGPLRGLSELLNVLPAQGKDPLLTTVKIVTDSKYVVDGMLTWVSGWKARGWKKADNKAPENIELWKSLDLVREKFMQVKWMWVKGHAGHAQNEYCDRKANEVMDEHLTR
jgi:ribonuclease HI